MASDEQALLLKLSVDLRSLQQQMDKATGVVSDGGAKMVLKSKEAMAAIEKSYGSVDAKGFREGLEKIAETQDKLTAAQLAGNTAEAKALREQLVLQQAVQKAATAQIETQLAVARAAGSKGQVAQLTEALALQTQLGKLQSVGLGGSKALIEAETAVNAVAAAEKAVEGVNVGKALDTVFDRSRLAVFEEGSAKIPIFGSAIEALGPVGLGAAAALATLGIAAEATRKSMEWADDLDRTSKKLGVTTTSLQELDYASIATSIGLQQGRDALGEFNGMIGKFESHTGDARLVKWADAIKLTRGEVNNTIDPVQKLSLVMEKIATLRDAQSRTAAAKAFGLDGLLPIINEGTEGIEKFIGKMAEAKANGSLVDPREIAKAAELNDKVEELSHRIDIDFKQAFINAAPAIEGVAEFIERCTHALAGFLGQLPLAIRGLDDLLSKLPHLPTGISVSQSLKDAAGNAALDLIPGGRQWAALGHAGAAAGRALVARGQVADLHDRIGSMLAGGKVDLVGSDFDPALGRQGTGQQLTPDKPKGGHKSDETDSLDKQTQAAYDNALKAAASAQAKLAATIDERAGFEQKALDAERDAQLDKLAEQEKAIRKAKNDAHKAEQIALVEKAKVEVNNKYLADTEALRRKTLADLIAQEAQLRQQILTNHTDALSRDQAHLTALAGLADTTTERTTFERQALAIAQERERDLADARTAQAKAALAEATATGDLAKIRLAQVQLDGAQAAQADLGRNQGDQSAAFDRSHESPLQQYLRSFRDLNSEMQTEGVKALDGVAGGVADIVANGAKAGDVLRSLVRQLLYDFTKMNVEQGEASLLGKFGIKLPNSGASAAASTVSTAMTTAGTTAGTSIASAMTVAGTDVAAQIAAAMGAGAAAGGGGGGGLGFISSLLGGGSGGAAGWGSAADAATAGGVSFDFGVSDLALAGFATGGSFTVGGMGGIDQNLVQFKASRGERVSIETPEQQRSRDGGFGAWHGDLVVNAAPGMSAADARRTGRQAAAAFMAETGKAAKAGYR